jgi:hypothetical protein
MRLNDKQKTLLFAALSALQDTIYYDDDYEQIDYNYNNYRLALYELREISQNDINKLNDLIDKTLSALC